MFIHHNKMLMNHSASGDSSLHLYMNSFSFGKVDSIRTGWLAVEAVFLYAYIIYSIILESK